jgi:hypothetical protein
MTANLTSNWKSRIDPALPCWRDYIKFLQHLGARAFPSPTELDELLPEDLTNERGQPIRFVPAEELPGVSYEAHIYHSGEVSTRADNWHDLFNALVWARLPAIKVAMNAVHHRETGDTHQNSRGAVRDALTLFDECGVIIASTNQNFLERLAKRDWGVFVEDTTLWQCNSRLIVTGHAILEKSLNPYKSMTAHALLIGFNEELFDQSDEAVVSNLDEGLATMILNGEILKSTACLSPLPLMGIPGWWAETKQDSIFYDDPGVFRSAPADLIPAAIHVLTRTG